jgi:hypothetical protein
MREASLSIGPRFRRAFSKGLERSPFQFYAEECS